MCGILGAIALKGESKVDTAAIDKLAMRLLHRGPDSGGFAHEASLSFACRRLAITDPGARSDQPYVDNDGVIVLVFNGQIYNHNALREEMRSQGVRFRTRSDTEVIAEAYKRWGPECVHRLNGMFAFALYDRRSDFHVIARDRLGIKPLYYAEINGVLIFGSEIKVVSGYPGFKGSFSTEAAIRFLRFRYLPFGDQYFKGLHKLPPGHMLLVRGGQVTLHCYWDLILGWEDERPAQDIADLIESSVTLQMQTETPLSLFLSGGVDSSILALYLAQAPVKVVAYTAVIQDADYDESQLAAQVAHRAGIQHKLVSIRRITTLEPVRQLIRVKDQPLGMHNEMAMAELASEAVQHGKVVLCGEGADEIFAGYARMFRFPFTFARHVLARGRSDNQCVDDPFWQYVLDRYFYMPDTVLMKLVRPEFRDNTADEELSKCIARVAASRSTRFQQLSYFLLKLHLPGLLEMVDAATMSASLEARVPYTDHRLVEVAFALPSFNKLKWRSPFHALAAAFLPLGYWSGKFDTPKAILQECFAPQLPEKVFLQAKKGFPVPLGKWLSDNEEVRDLILRADSPLHQFLLPDRLREWYRMGCAEGNDIFGRRLWLLINLGLFLELHHEREASLR